MKTFRNLSPKTKAGVFALLLAGALFSLWATHEAIASARSGPELAAYLLVALALWIPAAFGSGFAAASCILLAIFAVDPTRGRICFQMFLDELRD